MNHLEIQIDAADAAVRRLAHLAKLAFEASEEEVGHELLDKAAVQMGRSTVIRYWLGVEPAYFRKKAA